MATKRKLNLRPYRTWLVGHDGARKRIEANSVIVELSPGLEVELRLNPNRDVRGALLLMTPPFGEADELWRQGIVQTLASVFPGAGGARIWIERHVSDEAQDKAPRRPRRRSTLTRPGKPPQKSEKQ